MSMKQIEVSRSQRRFFLNISLQKIEALMLAAPYHIVTFIEFLFLIFGKNIKAMQINVKQFLCFNTECYSLTVSIFRFLLLSNKKAHKQNYCIYLAGN